MGWNWKSAISFLRRITDKPQKDLLWYVETNNIEEIERILLLYPELTTYRYYCRNERTILHIACCDFADCITEQTVLTLITSGCDLNYDDDYGYRALHYAAVGQNSKVLDLILRKSENCSSVTMNGDTALHLLIDTDVRNNREDFLQCIDLLTKNIDVNVLDNIFRSAIYRAIEINDQEVVDLLLNCNGIQIDVAINIENYEWNKPKARDCIKDASRIEIDEISVQLCNLIDKRRESQFLDLMKLNEKKYYNLIPYFVKKACYEKQFEIIKYFTCKTRTPDMTERFSMRTPFRVAIMDGLHEVIGDILENSQSRDEMDVEVELLQRNEDRSSNRICDYRKCLDIYLQKCPKLLDPNHERTKGNFILQRCIKFGYNDATLYLLNNGASLANKDVAGNITMTGIPFNLLKEHLDSCISLELEGLQKKVKFNYRSFLPTKSTKIPVDLESGDSEIQLKPEMRALLYMTKSLDLKTLLNHPLITSFVYLKWRKVKWIYYTNLILYIFFACIVILYLVPFYQRTTPGFALVFLVLILDAALFMKEIFQIMVFRYSYLRHFENYIEMSLAFSVATLIGYYFNNSSPPDELKASVILLIGFGFLYLLGSHPEFSTTIAMFRTVSYEYVKFLLFYVTIIICFAISFYTIFRNDTSTDSFKTPLTAIFKTLIMMTGEFDSGELDLHTHTFLTYIIYAAFVFSNAIVLLNLLNSLAVSDVQNIRNKAELFSSEATIKYIGVIESLLFKEFESFSCLNMIKKYMIILFANIIALYPNDVKDYTFSFDRNFDDRHYEGILDIAIVHRAVTLAEERKRCNENIKS